jgi:hypothetical protein
MRDTRIKPWVAKVDDGWNIQATNIIKAGMTWHDLISVARQSQWLGDWWLCDLCDVGGDVILEAICGFIVLYRKKA